jgi:hypothetical protein
MQRDNYTMRRLQRYVDRPTVGFLVYGVSMSAMFIPLAMGFGIMTVKEVQSPMAFALLNQSHLFLTLANCSQDTGPVPSNYGQWDSQIKKLQLTPDRKKPYPGR